MNLLYALGTQSVYAQVQTAPPVTVGLGLTNLGTISEVMVWVLDTIVAIAVPLLVLWLIYVGFMFVFARGHKDALKEAKSAFGSISRNY